MRRPFRAWVVIVAVVLGINVIRSLGTSGGFGGTGGATTAPGATALAPGSTAKTGAGGKTTTAVEVPAGTVIFGTSLNDACDVSGTATTFASGTPIWWYAHLNVTQASDAKVVTILKHDNEELDRGSGPTSSSGVWDGLCAGGPFKYYGSGPYRFEVWNEDEKLLLASGEYEIGK